VAYDFLAPFAAWLRSRHPLLRLEVLSSVHYADLSRREADLAIRWRAPRSPDLHVVASLDHETAAWATPEYLARLPPGYGMADVDWVCWAPPFQDTPPNPQLEALIPGFVPAFASDNFLVQKRAAEAGLGAIVLGDVRHRFAAPTRLVPLELDLGPYARSQIHLVCVRSALDTLRVRVVADLLAAELQRIQALG
jgi:DNA-binding transcriptional LysR family regulator